MKKTTSLLVGIFALSSIHSAFAMDLNSNKIKKKASVQTTLNPQSFADSNYPESGLFVSADMGTNHLMAKQSEFLFFHMGNSSVDLATKADKTEAKSSYGASIGYQNSNIQSPLFEFLAIKRFSFSLHYSHDGEILQSGALNTKPGDNKIFDYNTTIKASNRLMFDTKINVFKIWHLSPYIMAGLGAGQYQGQYTAKSEFENDTLTNHTAKSTNFVYQAGAGLDWFVAKGLTVSAGYNYIDAGKLDLPSTALLDSAKPMILPIKYTQIQFGLAYSF